MYNVKKIEVTLSGGSAVKVDGDEGVDDVGNPHGHSWRGVAADGECLRYCHKEDVGEAEDESDADVQPHAAFDLARRERHTDDC